MTPKQLLAREYYARNREKVKARVAKWAADNKEIVRQNHADWVAQNKERYAEIQKRYRSKPEVEKVITDRNSKWRAANIVRVRELERARAALNPDKARNKGSKRRAAERKAVPPWYGELDALVAAEAADLAFRRQEVTGFAWHIDHVVPLRGRFVCGLHVWNNLAVIPATANMKKSSKFDETMLDTNVLDALGSRHLREVNAH